MSIAPPRTAHYYAYASLRSQILSGTLAPGAALNQANLAHELGISMTPIREALRDLATEGLVTFSPHRGAVVTSLDLNDALEIHRIRLKLEPDASADAVQFVTDEVIQGAEDLYQRMVNASDGEWVTLNRDFHILLLSPNPSSRLKSILSSLLEAAALYVGVSMRHRQSAPQEEHRLILDAYKAGDSDAARARLTKHIEETVTSLEEAAETAEARGSARH
jgi:DNA-binding GntR family transcriptional regulator